MAERRMFAKTIVDSDAFIEMPQSTQLLYFHLSMRADDDGFINNPKSIMRNVGCKDDDIKILISKKFIIPFESGVVVIKHWKIHNYIQSDRYTPTKYTDEKSQLILDSNKAYKMPKPGEEVDCIQNVSKMDTQVRLGKDSLVKKSIDEDSNTLGSISIPIVNEENTQSDELTELIDLIESEFKRPISAFEIDKVKYWFDLVGYQYIVHGLRQCLIYSKKDINYLDKVLVRWTNDKVTLEMLNKGEKHK